MKNIINYLNDIVSYCILIYGFYRLEPKKIIYMKGERFK